MDLPVDKLSHMTPEQARQFWEQFEHELDGDAGEAAKSHLAAGRPIYYVDDAHPGQIIRQHPGGRRELINVDAKGQITVLKAL